MLSLLIILIAIILIIMYISFIYRKLSIKHNIAENKWNKINFELNKCADLVPGLIKIFEDYNGYDPLLLEHLMDSRKLLLNANTVTEHNQANNQLKDLINNLFKEFDKNQDIKKDSNLINLKNQLNNCEKIINITRNEYNKAVLDFNDLCQTFPYYYFTKLLGFTDKDYFKGHIEFNDHISSF